MEGGLDLNKAVEIREIELFGWPESTAGQAFPFVPWPRKSPSVIQAFSYSEQPVLAERVGLPQRQNFLLGLSRDRETPWSGGWLWTLPFLLLLKINDEMPAEKGSVCSLEPQMKRK